MEEYKRKMIKNLRVSIYDDENSSRVVLQFRGVVHLKSQFAAEGQWYGICNSTIGYDTKLLTGDQKDRLMNLASYDELEKRRSSFYGRFPSQMHAMAVKQYHVIREGAFDFKTKGEE